jgi:phosphoribosylamine--glycine ligase
MARQNVPTARFRICDSADVALRAIARGEFGYPLVIKADGLAAGKGVSIADDRAAAEAVIRDVMVSRKFGASGERVVLEEFLSGQEASYFVLAHGASFMPLSSAQDHKRIFDDDRGPNTGGMGAFAPSPLITADVERRVIETIVEPVLDGMVREGYPYRGFLYVGLMLTDEGPKVVEFNVRFGDPEAQVILPMLDEDLSSLLMCAANGALPSRHARFSSNVHVGVVLAAGGLSGTCRNGEDHFRHRSCACRAERRRFPRWYRQTKWRPGDRGRPGADRCWRGRHISRSDRYGIRRSVKDQLRRDAISPRYRPQSVDCP